MNLPQKIFSALRGLFFPGPAAYDERRSARVLIISILIGIVIAVGFGFALYHYNVTPRGH